VFMILMILSWISITCVTVYCKQGVDLDDNLLLGVLVVNGQCVFKLYFGDKDPLTDQF
jgi:hypothetical protein